MAGWVLVPCLKTLRDEFTAVAPGRDRTSDGAIGDIHHSRSSSDHNADETGNTPTKDADSINEVHAIDVDADLHQAGWSMERAVQIIVLRHRTGVDDRLQNVIFNGRIWSRSWGWSARVYRGSNQHEHHGHFSARYTSAQEADTRPWGLLAAANPVSNVKGGVVMVPVAGQLPELRQGMSGAVAGYHYIWRLQLLLGIEADDSYGPKTAAAIAKYNAENLRRKVDGKTVDVLTWKRLYAIK